MDKYYAGSSSGRSYVPDVPHESAATETQFGSDYRRSFPLLSGASAMSTRNSRSQEVDNSPPKNAHLLEKWERGSRKIYKTAHIIENDCRNVQQARKCLAALKDADLRPSHICYTNFIKVHYKFPAQDEEDKRRIAFGAVAVLDEMEANQITPNAISFSAVITACDALDQQDLMQQVLVRGVNKEIFNRNLGYASEARSLDFHEKAVVVGGGCREKNFTVPSAVVKAILDYHWGNLNKSHVSFIVGQGVVGTTRNVVTQYIESKGYTALNCYTARGKMEGVLRASEAKGVMIRRVFIKMRVLICF